MIRKVTEQCGKRGVQTFNQRVVGSIPTGLTNYSNSLKVIMQTPTRVG
jgi:hypothetical protein